MTSGYQKGGTDLDSIFAAWHTGWPQAAVTGYKVGGADLNARYAPLSTGTAAAATGYEKGGADLNTIFAAAGTTGVQVATQPSAVTGSAAAGNPSGTVTSNATTCAGTKGEGSYTFTWHIASGSGVIFTAGSSATTAVTGTVNAGATISGTMFCTISDGVTSVNTSTVGWSLTNTTSPADLLSLTAGNFSIDFLTGYSFQLTVGSLTPTTLGDGTTVVELATVNNGSTNTLFLEMSGFSSDPTAAYVVHLIINGQTWIGTSAGYSYSSGKAEWGWSGPTDLISGNTYPVQILRNNA